LTLLTPIFGFALVRKFGAAGAAAGTSLAFLLATGYLLLVFHRNYVENSVRTVLEEVYLRPIGSGVFAGLAVIGIHRMVPLLMAWEAVRYMIPVKMAMDFAVFTPTYILLLVVFRQVTAIDWNNFLSLLSFASELLRHPFREHVKIYRSSF
jgi:hypothetical protein